MIRKVEVVSEGLSPLLMHRFPMEPIEALEKKTPQEQAEYAAYRIPDTKELYVPGTAIQRALVAAATYSKGKGRSTLQKVAAACVIVDPEYVSLGTSDYIIDTRPIVVPATKGRVLRHRPRLNKWSITYTIEYDDTLLNERQLRQIVDDMGRRVGLLDFRPACKGPFGRSVVISWKPES